MQQARGFLEGVLMTTYFAQELAALNNALAYFSPYAETYKKLELNVNRYMQLEASKKKLNWEPLTNDFKRIRKEEYLMAGLIITVVLQHPMAFIFRLLKKESVPLPALVIAALLSVLCYHLIKKNLLKRRYDYLADKSIGVLQAVNDGIQDVCRIWTEYMDTWSGSPVFIEPIHTDPVYLERVLRSMEKEQAGCQAVTSVVSLPEYMQYVFYEFEKYTTAYMESHQS